jgi:hypothetical protein
MSNHKLFIDRRVAVTGAKSKILMDNPVAMHTFISNYIASNPTIVTSIIEDLPVYADDAAAGVGGLTAGQLYKNSTTNTISYKA